MSISDERLAEILAGLDGVTPGPRHMYVSPTDILVTDDAGNNVAHFLPMDDDSNADFVNATSFARCDPETLRAIFTELQSLRAAAKVRAICEGDGEAKPAEPACDLCGDKPVVGDIVVCDGCGRAYLTPADNLEAGAGDLVERTPSGETVAGMTVLGWMTEVDVPGIGPLRRTVYHWSTPGAGQKVIRLVDAAEAAAQLSAVTAENARLREALDRQCDNMAFVLNRVNLHAWHDKFSRELEEDRAALSQEAPK